MKKPEIQIEVVSDVVCPWCYIGKRRLEKAVDELKDQFDISITFSPFELNAEMPVQGVDQKEYLISKFGSEERYHKLIGHVTQVAREEGLAFDYAKQRVSPNTRVAHRLIRYAHEEGKQTIVKEALMKAYFEEGIDLSKSDNLMAIATKVGLAKEKVKLLLESDEGEAEVVFAEKINQQRGVNGVPFYIINNKYGVSGAQPSETFVKMLTQVGQEVTQSGESCEVDDKEC